MKLTIEIKDCTNCPMKRDHRGHGECWTYCSHPESPKGYDNILWGCREEFTALPDWCPIMAKEGESA